MKSFLRQHSAAAAVLVLVLISLGGILVAYRQSEADRDARSALNSADGSAPTAVLDATDFDWGEIGRTQIVEHDFTLRNTGLQGTADLVVSEIVTSCGCTTAELRLNGASAVLPANIPPGDSGIVHVVFDPDAHDSRGATERAVRIETNDPRHPFLVITLHAYVR